MIDAETLRKVARTKGIVNLGFAEKDYFQEILLLAISRERPDLVFKGGTALYKLHGLDRFSEDLDFTGSVNERDVGHLSSFIADFGYGVDFDIRTVKMGTLIRLNVRGHMYNGTPRSLTRIQMDVNDTSDVILSTDNHPIFPLYPDLPPFRVTALDVGEMMCEKMRGLLVRNKARDAYDVAFLLGKGVNIDGPLLNRKLRLYDMGFRLEILEGALDKVARNWERELKAMVTDLPEFAGVRKVIERGTAGLC